MDIDQDLNDDNEEKNFDTENDSLSLQRILFENIDDDESDEEMVKGVRGNEKDRRPNEINEKSLSVSGQGSVQRSSDRKRRMDGEIKGPNRKKTILDFDPQFGRRVRRMDFEDANISSSSSESENMDYGGTYSGRNDNDGRIQHKTKLKSTKRSEAKSPSNQINLKSAKRSDVLSPSNESHRGASDSPRRSRSRSKSVLAIGAMFLFVGSISTAVFLNRDRLKELTQKTGDESANTNIQFDSKKGEKNIGIAPIRDSRSLFSLHAELKTDFNWNDGTSEFSKCYQLETDLKSIMEEHKNIEKVTMNECKFKQNGAKSKAIFDLTVDGTSLDDIAYAASETIKAADPNLYASLSSLSADSYIQQIFLLTTNIVIKLRARIETNFKWNDGASKFSKCHQIGTDLESIIEKDKNIEDVTMTECELIQVALEL